MALRRWLCRVGASMTVTFWPRLELPNVVRPLDLDTTIPPLQGLGMCRRDAGPRKDANLWRPRLLRVCELRPVRQPGAGDGSGGSAGQRRDARLDGLKRG